MEHLRALRPRRRDEPPQRFRLAGYPLVLSLVAGLLTFLGAGEPLDEGARERDRSGALGFGPLEIESDARRLASRTSRSSTLPPARD